MADFERQDLQSQKDVVAELCKLAKIPSDKMPAFSSVVMSTLRQHEGKLGVTRRLPYQKEILPPLHNLAKRLTALDEALSAVFLELRTYSSEPWRLSAAAEARACLLMAGFGSREAEAEIDAL